MSKTRTLGAVLFNDFELLDLCGPLEMFSYLGKDIRIVTLAENKGAVKSVQGPSLVAEEDFDSSPELDILLVPGGIGTNTEQDNSAMLDFIRKHAPGAELVTSVCTGSALLAAAGVLDGSAATSNKLFFDLARSQSDAVDWQEEARWVEDGKFFTSSGVSAGTDMALAVIAHLFGQARAEEIAVMTEYNWHQAAENDPFKQHLNQGSLDDFLRAVGHI